MPIEQIIQIATVWVVVFFGFRILERLPKSGTDPSFKFECPDRSISLRVDAITEQEFEIGFVDSWDVGRAFMIGGKVLPADDPERLKNIQTVFGTRERVVVHIYPTVEWFKTSAIGHLRTYDGPAAEAYIGLPYQLAYQVLSELRRDPDQIVSFNFQREETANGKEIWRIYNLGIEKPL